MKAMLQQEILKGQKVPSSCFRLSELQQDLAMKFSSCLTRFRHSCKKIASHLSAASQCCCSFSYMNYFLQLSSSLDYNCPLPLFLALLLPINQFKSKYMFALFVLFQSFDKSEIYMCLQISGLDRTMELFS